MNKAFSFNGPAWSISIEFFLYACFPLLVLLLARASRRGLLVVALSVIVALVALAWWFSGHDEGMLSTRSSHRWLYRSPLTRLGDFTLGIITARIYANARESKVGGTLATLGVMAIVGLMCWHRLFYTSWSWDIAYAVPAVMVIAGLVLAPRGMLARALSWPLVVKLGEASFAFYLIHVTMVQILGAGGWRDEFTLASTALEVSYLAIILCLSWVMHMLVELPARTHLRRLSVGLALRVAGDSARSSHADESPAESRR